MLFANEIRVNMGALASMTESTDAVARKIIKEKHANVSVISVMYNYKINVHNFLYSRV